MRETGGLSSSVSDQADASLRQMDETVKSSRYMSELSRFGYATPSNSQVKRIEDDIDDAQDQSRQCDGDAGA